MRRVGVALLVGLVVGVAVGVAPAAAADHGSVPDGSGAYVHCNVSIYPQTWASSGNPPGSQWAIACQYGPTNQTVQVNGGTTPLVITSNVQDFGSVSASMNTGGQYRAKATGQPRTVGTVSAASVGCKVAVQSTYHQGSPGCVVDSVSFAQVDPRMPADHYPGGTDGDPDPVPAPTVTCTRKLTQVANERIGKFVGTTNIASAPAGSAVDTFSWDFGDSSTAGEGSPVSHTYAGSQPDNGWTATVTATRTLQGSFTWGDGTAEPKTKTCALRVDFANPDQMEAGSGSETGESDDCPSGWGWLDPSSLGDMLTCLFVPADVDTSGMTTAFSDHFPFSLASSYVDGMVSLNGAITTSWSSGTGCPGPIDFGSSALNNIVPGMGAGKLARVTMPTPSEAGCRGLLDEFGEAGGDCPGEGAQCGGLAPGQNDVGNVWGYREPLRFLFRLFLWGGLIAGLAKRWIGGDGSGDTGGDQSDEVPA